MDSELDKPGKSNWGLTDLSTGGPLPSLPRAGQRRRVPGSASSESSNENSERQVSGEVEAHGQREVRGERGERVMNSILPSKARCRFS